MIRFLHKVRQGMAPLGYALTFLTRIPLPFTIPHTESTPTRSMAFYPLVGGIIGGVLVFFDLLLSRVFPFPLANALLLVILVYLTGGLHLDGLMDSFDGLFSCRDRETMLNIMHDSRTGAFGIIGCVLLLMVKLHALLALTAPVRTPALLIFPVISRSIVVLAAHRYPTADASRLGTSFAEHLTRAEVLHAVLIATCILVIVQFGTGFPLHIGLGLLLAAYIYMLFFSRKMIIMLGGLTGDLYGMLIESAELLVLLIAAGLYG